MATIVGIVGVALQFKFNIRSNQPNDTTLSLCKPWINFNSHLKQLYISNKTECFSYKGGYGILERTCIETFKTRAVLDYTYTDKHLWVISNIMLLKTLIPLKN